MRHSDYRAAFDSIPFREDFQRETLQRLRQSAGQRTEKEYWNMKKKRFALVAAALSALLVVSAAATVMLLSPKEVARRTGQQVLAQAFESEDAVTINKAETVEDFHVTLMGMVSGENLSGLEESSDIVQDRTYAVLSMARCDGEAIITDDAPLTVSPLVEGFAPWQVNAWTLGGGASYFTENGILYYLFECDNVNIFADHTVYLAVYPGTHTPPSAEIFSFGEDGKIGVQNGKEVVLFPLPLDPAKADPAAVAQLTGPTQPMPGEESQDLQAVPGDKKGEFLIVPKETD